MSVGRGGRKAGSPPSARCASQRRDEVSAVNGQCRLFANVNVQMAQKWHKDYNDNDAISF